MPLPFQAPIQVSAFNGGVTDTPSTGNPSQAQAFRNFMPDKDNTARSRNGSKFHDESNNNFAGSATRIGNLVSYDSVLFAQVVKDLKYVSGGTVVYLRPARDLITGQIYTSGDSTSVTAFHEFNKHLFTTSDHQSVHPMVIVKDDSLAYRARTVGMPQFPSGRYFTFTSAEVDTATDQIKNPDTALLGATTTSYDGPVSSVGTEYFSFFVGQKIKFSTTGTLPSPLVPGTEYFVCFPRDGRQWIRVASNYANAAGGIFLDLTTGGSGTHKVEVIGDNQASVGVIFQTLATVGDPDLVWLYYFSFFYEYTTATGDTNQIYGGTILKECQAPTGYVDTAVAGTRIINIPKIGSGTFDIAQKNYDTSGTRIKVKIYRTQVNGITPYYVGQVNNGTTTFDDNISDSNLQFSGEVLYIDGGILNNDTVTRYTYMTSVNDFLFAGDITENIAGVDVRRRNRICQSKPFEPEQVLTGLFVDLAGPVTGLGSYAGFPIAFTDSRAYRLEGTFDALGQGGIALRDISKTVGCISHNSIVETPSGLYWAGKDGFYVSTGSNVTKISRPIDKFYRVFVSSETRKKRIKGCYDAKNKIVFWSVCSDEVSEENNELWMFDEDTGLSRSGLDLDAAFYHWDNGRHFKPTAITVHNDNLIRGDSRGFVFEHDEDYTNDVYISSATDSFYIQPDLKVAEIAIPFDYVSVFFDFGNLHVRKWVNELKTWFENGTSIGVDIQSSNNGNSVFKAMTPIQFLNGFVWGAQWVVWGDPDYTWGDTTSVYATRSFPRGQRRCESKQIQFKSLEDSLILQGGTVTVTSGGTQATTIVGDELPTDLTGYFIYLSSDAGLTYPVNAEIVGQSGSYVLNILSAEFVISNGSYTYQIRGTRKDERIRLLKYSINYAPIENAGSTKKEEGSVRN